MASLWDPAFAALGLAARPVLDDPEDWQAAAELFAHRAAQHRWSADDVANFARALASVAQLRRRSSFDISNDTAGGEG
jgi:hypothetical protein